MVYNKKDILSVLHGLQQESYKNYISKDDLIFVARSLGLTYGYVYGVATYYKMFSLIPRGKYIIKLCKSPVCNMLGSMPLLDFLLNKFRIKEGFTTEDGLFTVDTVECLGQCDKSPCMLINTDLHGNLTKERIVEIIVHYRDSLPLKVRGD